MTTDELMKIFLAAGLSPKEEAGIRKFARLPAKDNVYLSHREISAFSRLAIEKIARLPNGPAILEALLRPHQPPRRAS